MSSLNISLVYLKPRSGKRWWREGKKHIEGKAILRAVAKKYGYNSREEEPLPVDLHELYPNLYPKRHVKPYQADLCIFKGKNEEFKEYAEVDGGCHDEKEDAIRDDRIEIKYGKRPRRFDEYELLKGKYSEEEIARRLGLI